MWSDLRAFLQSFGGLSVSLVRNERSDNFWFDPERAMSLTHESWVQEYARRAGQALVPMGYAAHDHLLLLRGEDGTWYGGYDDAFGVVGEDDDEVLDNLASGEFVLQDP